MNFFKNAYKRISGKENLEAEEKMDQLKAEYHKLKNNATLQAQMSAEEKIELENLSNSLKIKNKKLVSVIEGKEQQLETAFETINKVNEEKNILTQNKLKLEGNLSLAHDQIEKNIQIIMERENQIEDDKKNYLGQIEVLKDDNMRKDLMIENIQVNNILKAQAEIRAIESEERKEQKLLDHQQSIHESTMSFQMKSKKMN